MSGSCVRAESSHARPDKLCSAKSKWPGSPEAPEVNKEMASVYRSGQFVGLLVSQLSYILYIYKTLTYKLQLSRNEERCRSFEEGCDERTQCLKWWKVRAFGIEMTGKWTWQTMYCLQDKNCSTRSCKAEKTTRTSKIGYFRAWSMIERRVISGFACVSSVLFPHDSIYWNVELSNMSNPTCLFPFFSLNLESLSISRCTPHCLGLLSHRPTRFVSGCAAKVPPAVHAKNLGNQRRGRVLVAPMKKE